jgi:cytochrome P450
MTKAAPVIDWIDPSQLVVDPYPTYARLREEAPVAYVPFLGMYLAARYDDCRLIESDTEHFSADRDTPTRRAIGRSSLIDSDDPDHAAVRGPINAGLRPKAVKANWTEAFEKNARYYLDRLAEAEPGTADLNSLVASPLATKNLMDLLGIRGVEVDVVRTWSSTLMEGVADIGGDPEVWTRVDGVRTDIDTLLAELLPYLRENPDGTFTSSLANSGLPDDVVGASVKLAIAGGINEPQHAITSMVWALTENPEQRDAVFADPELWPDVFEETLRWMSPLSLIPMLVLKDVEMRGVTVPAGATITALIASGNRDESVFERSGDFDIRRPKVAHLAFGSGRHMCAGMWAARWAIGSIAVPKLYKRFAGLRTVEHGAEGWSGFVVRGLGNCPVTWDADLGPS